jgi:hypothetical protein
MKSIKLLVSLALAVAFAIFMIAGVSAFAGIGSVEVKGVETLGGTDISVFSGETIPVRIVFTAFNDAEDVRVKAWIAGESDLAISSERFDVLAGSTYSRLVSVKVPSRLDPSENLQLEVLVENRNDGIADQRTISLAGQRESYNLEVLDVAMDTKVKAGTPLALDVVLKNRGRQFAEDTFVKVSIPALGIEEKAYFGDLSDEDKSDPDKEDSAERRMFLDIPSSASAGVYTVEVSAFNADSEITVTRKIAIVGAGEDTLVASPLRSRTLAVGEVGEYSFTLVNTGNTVLVYELAFETSSGLSLEASEPIVVVPAGTSRTVKVSASADEAGEYAFAVNVNSGGETVKTVDFTAKVEGSKAIAGNATVLLTVVLAIIFVVLLVVLIVLLTRKPEKVEEFGESYY